MVENVRELLKLHEGIKREVYLDNENSTVPPPEVVEAMLPYYTKAYGNPTLTHKPGWEAFTAIMEASQKIAGYIGAKTLEEINFTPGESEANNLALMGAAAANPTKGKKIVISEIEPINVLNVTDLMKKQGYTTNKVPVSKEEGVLDLEKLKEAVDKETAIVSIHAVNNEIGTLQPIKEVVDIVKDRNPQALVHTDATDAYGRVPFNVQNLKVDLATISSFKILGPRGTAALYIREGVNVERIIEGPIGTQRLWPGVENTPLIMGFTKASDLAFSNFDGNVTRMRQMRDKLVNGIFSSLTDITLNGTKLESRSPDNANISFRRCEGEALTIELSLKGVYVSSGSACSRRALQPSHVLIAIGRHFSEAHGSILMKTTRYHTEEDINHVLNSIPSSVERIRGIVGSTGVD